VSLDDPFGWVDPDTIRRAFNDARYFDRMRSGELRSELRRMPHHLTLRLARSRGEPRCTWSQVWSYIDSTTGRQVAIVHQYRRRDGTLGASGLPDPKWLRLSDGRIIWTD
jgi:hypothetical protein